MRMTNDEDDEDEDEDEDEDDEGGVGMLTDIDSIFLLWNRP
jgi:hypothetical protein